MFAFVLGLIFGGVLVAAVAYFRPQWLTKAATLVAAADAVMYPFHPVTLVQGAKGHTGPAGPVSLGVTGATGPSGPPQP
jgi:hypothetical protein